MKIWMETNTTSSNNKGFVLVDLIEVLSEKKCLVRKPDGSTAEYLIGYHDRGPILDNRPNRFLIDRIINCQKNINAAFEDIRDVERCIDRKTLEEIGNDPNF